MVWGSELSESLCDYHMMAQFGNDSWSIFTPSSVTCVFSTYTNLRLVIPLIRIPIQSSAHSLALSQFTHHTAVIYLEHGGRDACDARRVKKHSRPGSRLLPGSYDIGDHSISAHLI